MVCYLLYGACFSHKYCCSQTEEVLKGFCGKVSIKSLSSGEGVDCARHVLHSVTNTFARYKTNLSHQTLSISHSTSVLLYRIII